MKIVVNSCSVVRLAFKVKLFLVLCLGLVFLSVSSAPAQTWRTSRTDSNYKRLSYPLVFVAAYRDSSRSNGGNLGTDVIQAGNPDRGHELWILLPDGNAKKLFPYVGVHDGLVDYPIGPSGGRINGSVTEPSIAINGRWVYFSYFHDQRVLGSHPNLGNNKTGPRRGSDIYVMDLSAIIANPAFDPRQLPVARLTQTADIYADAMNPGIARSPANPPNRKGNPDDDFRRTYMSPVEFDQISGRKLAVVSDLRRTGNSNQAMWSEDNRNFNIFEFDLEIDGSWPPRLENMRQFQYYTTTSALSPFRQKNGLAFSYQATTEENRQWQIQSLDSEGRWGPLYGYGIQTFAAHLGTYCVRAQNGSQPRAELAVINVYYNLTNNGFGWIVAQDYSKVGTNYMTVPNAAWQPRQVGSYVITHGVVRNDVTSPDGKFSTPACGGPDELFLAYSPTPSNHLNSTRDLYPSYITFTGLDAFHVRNTPNAQQPVVRSTNNQWSALWPKPVVDWDFRQNGVAHPQGASEQEYADPIVDPDTVIAAGMPYATVGTSALHNTDISPPDCRLPENRFHPEKSSSHGMGMEVHDNVDGLSWVQNFGLGRPNNRRGVCEPLKVENVFGIAIYQTSNKLDIYAQRSGNRGYYATEGLSSDRSTLRKESKELLGVYTLQNQNRVDSSFSAIVPANVPVDFQLLHRNYALKMADVRSWHSLKPRETRNDCGGCHNHLEGEGIAWEGTYSAGQNVVPLDMVNITSEVKYDNSCNPFVQNTQQPATAIPTWNELAPGFDQHCGSCHAAGSSNAQARRAFSYTADELLSIAPSTYTCNNVNSLIGRLACRGYIVRKYGALSSPVFWAARGHRTDGRDNNFAAYQPDYGANDYGYRFSAVHASIGPRGNGLCDGDPSNGSIANWVYRFGLWLDNHIPQDSNAPTGVNAYHFDRYHPTVDGALTDSNCQPSRLRIGYWDSSGLLDRVLVKVNGNLIQTYSNGSAGLPNGFQELDISGLSSTDSMTVEAIDQAGNRQSYSKTVDRLVVDCTGAPPAGQSPGSRFGGGVGGGSGSGGDNGNSGSGSGSGGDGGEPGGGDDSSFLRLSLSGSQQPGQLINFELESSFQGGDGRVVCTTRGSGSDSVDGIQSDLKEDKHLFIYSSDARDFEFSVSAGAGNVRLRIPKNFRAGSTRISCQALARDGFGVEYRSNVLQLDIQKPNKKNRKEDAKQVSAGKVQVKFLRAKVLVKAQRQAQKRACKGKLSQSKACSKAKRRVQKLRWKLIKLVLKKKGMLFRRA